MLCTRLRGLVWGGFVLLNCGAVFNASAGGSGLNTVVVANQNSPDSCELANYYCERRGVPPDNLLRISWPGTNTVWSSSDFQTNLLNPLLDMLASRGLSNQVDYVVLSMDIPYETSTARIVNGTTSALFYGLKANGDPGVTNSYAGSEAVFRQAHPASAPGSSFLGTMLTADSLAAAEQLVEQGVASDGTFPPQPVVLAKSSDPVRSIRCSAYDNAIFNVNVRGVASILRTNTDSLWGQASFLGYETGLANLTLPPSAFVPGAIADSLTSFGGDIFDPQGQTTLLAFVHAGASGSYGTVSEPGTDAQKFPDPQVYFYQARGFSLAEAYYQSLSAPYLGLMLAEPLAAPFAETGWGRWGLTNVLPLLNGATQLTVSFTAGGSAPLQQADLFVDGKYFSTLTNMAPLPGNVLRVGFNGYPVTYTVPPDATLGLVAAGLAAALNAPGVTNYTQAAASAHGDRVELRSFFADLCAAPCYVAYAPAPGSPGRFYSVTYLPYPVPPQLTALGPDTNGAFRLRVTTPDAIPYVVEATTNLRDWLALCTNPAGDTLVFSDLAAANEPFCFYRVAGQLAGPPPQPDPPIYAVQSGPGGSDLVQIDWASRPYVVQVSTNDADWTPIFTNLAPNQYQMTADSSSGSAGGLDTFLTASRCTYLNSTAFGLQLYRIPRSSLSVGAWVQLTITKTNNEVVSVGITNQVNGGSSTNVAGLLCAAINSNAALQSSDGVAAEDFAINAAGTASFNLRARSSGYAAAAVQVLPKRSGVTILPASQGTLTQNLSDLQPRNHLYITAGAAKLAVSFLLDTAALADGYHELTAVAYEGSHVRTQTQTTLPVWVQNSSLSATLTLLDLPETAPVEGTYHIQVAANTNTVSGIGLFSTGGLLGSVLNQSAATFTFSGSTLGAGLHPFYALVETADGLKYRTELHWVRLVNGP